MGAHATTETAEMAATLNQNFMLGLPAADLLLTMIRD
jgi:hypothetical protein